MQVNGLEMGGLGGREEGRKEGEKGCVAEVDFWGGEDFINLAKVVKFS